MRFAFALPLLSATPFAHAWGELGHRTVAYLAEKYLTSEGSNLVSTLLANDRGWDISDAALWADSIKRRKGYTHTGAWHYIDAADDPPRNCGVVYKRDCHEGPGCIVSAITNFTGRVNDEDLDADQQKEALMFLIHFIGDIHQPLHTELLDKGGNGIKVEFDGRNENLHSVWDKNIPHKLRGLPPSEGDDTELKEAAAAWAEELYVVVEIMGLGTRFAECSNIKTAEKCALVWANEANAHICDNVLKPGVAWIKRNDLGDRYFESAVPVVNELVAKAGLRLGAWINKLAAGRPSNTFVDQTAEHIEV